MKLDLHYALELKTVFEEKAPNGGGTFYDMAGPQPDSEKCEMHLAWLVANKLLLTPDARLMAKAKQCASLLEPSNAPPPIKLERGYAKELLGKLRNANLREIGETSMRAQAHVGWLVKQGFIKPKEKHELEQALGYAKFIDDGTSEAAPSLHHAVSRLPWWFVLSVSGLLLYVTYLAFGGN